MFKNYQKPNYGIDAPYIILGFFGASILLFFFGIGLAIFANHWFLKRMNFICFGSSFYCLINAILMLASSLYGKKRQTEYLISLLNLKGDETILDVGCGRGLVLIAAAKQLTTGKAIGIDIWQQTDQWNNSKENTLLNIKLEKVGDKITIIDADVRTIPFAEKSFDIVMSSLVIHNLSSSEEREKAVKEMIRVLKPGGKLIIQDFQYTNEYKALMQTYGLYNIQRSGLWWWIFPPVRIIIGIKKRDKLLQGDIQTMR